MIKTLLENLTNKINAFAYKFGLIVDYVVDNSISTDANGYSTGYTKWASGKMECWVVAMRNAGSATAWGSLYYGSVPSITYPQPFVSKPVLSIQIKDSNRWILSYSGDKTKTGDFFCITATSKPVETFAVYVFAIGNWK